MNREQKMRPIGTVGMEGFEAPAAYARQDGSTITIEFETREEATTAYTVIDRALSASKAEAEDSELAERLRFGAANNGATLEAEECAALLSSHVPAITDEAVERAARMALMYLETGFMACDRCGHEMETKTTDACHELRTAFPSKGEGE